MTKEVLISITGIHTDIIEKGEEDEPVAVITPAKPISRKTENITSFMMKLQKVCRELRKIK